MNIDITITWTQPLSAAWMTWSYILPESSTRNAFFAGLILFIFVEMIFAIGSYLDKQNKK